MKRNYRKVNTKYVAFSIEIALLVIGSIIVLILDGIKKQINIFIWVGIYAVLLFALLLTLSLIRYERLREIRLDFKETNLPLYTDNISLMGHDIIDEEENKGE